MDQWLKRGSWSQQLNNTKVNTGVTDVSKSQCFMSPSSIDSSRTAESSKKRATLIPVCLWVLRTQVTKLPRTSYKTSATKYYQTALCYLPHLQTYTLHIRTNILDFFFTPKLKTSTDCQSLTLKSWKTDEENVQGLLQCEVSYGT
jgi:hypothetical protein